MDIWGTEVKKGQSEILRIPSGMHLHLSLATIAADAPLGERVNLECEADGTKVVLCCLSPGSTDNVILNHYISAHHQSVTLSVTGKEGGAEISVFVSGYMDVEEEPEDDFDYGSSDEEGEHYPSNFGGFYGSEDEEADEDAIDYMDSDEEEDDEVAPPLVAIKDKARIEEITEEEPKEEKAPKEAAAAQKDKKKKKKNKKKQQDTQQNSNATSQPQQQPKKEQPKKEQPKKEQPKKEQQPKKDNKQQQQQQAKPQQKDNKRAAGDNGNNQQSNKKQKKDNK